MNSGRVIITWIILIAFGVTGCASMQGKTNWNSPGECIAAHTVGGTVLGAVAGAAVGLLTGGGKNVGKGALIGAGAGGVLAFAYAWGHCFAAFSSVKSREVKNYSETRREINYNKQQGDIVRIRSFDLQSYVTPGGKLKLQSDYVVMADTEKNDIPVIETRTLKVFDPEKKEFVEIPGATVPETVVISPGTRIADGEIEIPDNAEEGKYMIAFKIESLNKTDIKELPFTVTKNKQLLAKNKVKFKEKKVEEQTYASAGTKNVESDDTKHVVVTVSRLNIRELPNTSCSIVGKLSKGDKPVLIESKIVGGEQWFQIKSKDGIQGWISAIGSKAAEN